MSLILGLVLRVPGPKTSALQNSRRRMDASGTSQGSILIDFGLLSSVFFWNNINFNWKSTQNDCGRPQNILNVIFSLNASSKLQFWTPNWILNFLTSLKFQFSPITPFLDHIFSIPYRRNPSYGPYGPFWFSANFGRDMEKPYQKNTILRKSDFLR